MGDMKFSSFNLRGINFAGRAKTRLYLTPHALSPLSHSPSSLQPILVSDSAAKEPDQRGGSETLNYLPSLGGRMTHDVNRKVTTALSDLPRK